MPNFTDYVDNHLSLTGDRHAAGNELLGQTDTGRDVLESGPIPSRGDARIHIGPCGLCEPLGSTVSAEGFMVMTPCARLRID